METGVSGSLDSSSIESGTADSEPFFRDIEQRIEHEKLRMQLGQLTAGLASGFAVAVLFVVVLWDKSGANENLINWFITANAILLLRIGTLYLARYAYQSKEMLPLKKCLIIDSALSGLTWALISIIVYPEDPIKVAWIIVVILGMAAGTVVVRAPFRTGTTICLSIMIVPLFLRLALSADLNAIALSILMVCFLGIMLLMSKRYDGLLSKSLSLRYRNLDLIKNLSSAVQRAELTNKQLEIAYYQIEDAMRKAQASTEAKSLFLANMSHEIRTPMNGIIGMLGLLQETSLDEEQKDFADAAYTSANGLLHVLNDILDYSKIDAGKLEFENFEFGLTKVLEETIEIHSLSALGKGLDIGLIIDRNVPKLLSGDPMRLKQAISNLLSNAVKYTKEGGIKVLVSLSGDVDDPDKVELKFAVADTGIGVPEENSSLLFQPFSQCDSSFTRRYGGTGLGLMISKRLVELMDGKIGMISNPEGGSTFWFTAKFDRCVDVDPEDRKQNTELHPETVIIASDRKQSRETIIHCLNGWGMSVIEYPEVSNLIDALRDGIGDAKVIIIDVEKITKGLKSLVLNLKKSGCRLIALFPIISLIDRKALGNLGFDDFLSQPVKPSALKNILFKKEKVTTS